MEPPFSSPRRYPILNTYVDALSLDETIAEVEKIIEARVPTQHVVINASKVNLMESDSALRGIVNACPLSTQTVHPLYGRLNNLACL